MTDLDPTVGDLLVAIHGTLRHPDGRYDVLAAVESIGRCPTVFPLSWGTGWLTDRAGERGDAERVRRADRWQAAGEVARIRKEATP